MEHSEFTALVSELIHEAEYDEMGNSVKAHHAVSAKTFHLPKRKRLTLFNLAESQALIVTN